MGASSRAIVFAAAVLLVAGREPASSEPMLGILEERQECDASTGKTVVVEPLFARSGDDWTSLSEELQPLESLSWTVLLDGRSIGVLRTEPGAAGERLVSLVPGQRVPAIRNTNGGFRGWCGTPTRRPLAVTSRADVRDPDRWRPFEAPQELCSRLFQAFRAEAGDASCGDGRGNIVEVPYHAEDLRVASAWRDRAGRQLVAVVLPFEERCDGPWEGPWKARWFLVTGESARYLGSNFELIDVGDYDADGTSEILFRYSAYDEDGYTLFHDGLLKRTDHHRRYP
jgi:hypothetical protein